MASPLLEIQPQELKFVFELKKQTSCTVQLANNTNQYVAFKIKTTSPKKYSVRPNVGIVLPKSTSEFTVTMQAQRSSPPDMVCKDKFLIQSTIVPGLISEERITAALFSRDNGKRVEEVKLRVVLVSPPRSPVLSPMSETLPQDPYASMVKEPVLSKIEILTPVYTIGNELKQFSEELEPVMNANLEPGMYMANNEESKLSKSAELKPTMYVSSNEKLRPEKEAEFRSPVSVVDNGKLNPADDADLKSKNFSVNGEQLKPAQDAVLKSTNYVVNDEDLNPGKDVDLESKNDVVDSKEANVAGRVVGFEDLKSPINSKVNSSNDGNAINSEELKRGGDSKYSPLKDLELKSIELVEEKLNGTKNHLPKDVELRNVEPMEELKKANGSNYHVSAGLQLRKFVEESNVIKDIQEIKSKLNELESKLRKTEETILQLNAERTLSIQERETLKEDLALLSSKENSRQVQVGFPPLFVLMVAIISVVVGFFS